MITKEEWDEGDLYLDDLLELVRALRRVARATQGIRHLAAEKAWMMEEVESVDRLDKALDAVPQWVLDSEE